MKELHIIPRSYRGVNRPNKGSNNNDKYRRWTIQEKENIVDNKDENDNDVENDDDDDIIIDDKNSDRLTLLAKPPQTTVANNNKNDKNTSHSFSTSLKASPTDKRNKNNKKRRLLKRKHYFHDDYCNNNDDLFKSSFDIDPTPDTLDSMLKPFWLGIGLFLVLLSFWILDVLKDPVFAVLVDGNLESSLPTAKLVSVCLTASLVICLEYVSHEQEKHKNNKTNNQIDQNRRQQALVVQAIRQETGHDDHHQPDQQQDDVVAVDGMIGQENERTAMEILHDKGEWSKMETTTSTDYDDLKYDAIMDDESKHRVPSSIFATIGVPYCITFAIMAYFLQFNPSLVYKSTASSSNIITTTTAAVVDAALGDNVKRRSYWTILGYIWYGAIESFGSIQVATFWSYTNSTLSLHDAELYYGYIISMAQLGAILGTTMVTTHIWSNVTLTVAACLIILLHIIVMISYSKRFPPSSSSATSPAATEKEQHIQNMRQQKRRMKHQKDAILYQQQQTMTLTNSSLLDTIPVDKTLWSGIYLILKHNYVVLILGVSCLYEVSLTILNYQMTLLGWNRYEVEEKRPGHNDISFTQFMGHYGQMVNVCSLLLSSILFPYVIKRFGLRRTLYIFPTLLVIANMLAFGALPGNLTVLFIAMSLLKAMTYSIHDPSKEILYIPTSNAIKYKSKFWIDVVGARFAKAIGSGINAHSGSVIRSIKIASAPSILTAIALWITCYKAGNQFETLIASGHIVGIDDDDDEDTPVVGANTTVMYDEVDDDDDDQAGGHGRQRRNAVGDGPESISLTAV